MGKSVGWITQNISLNELQNWITYLQDEPIDPVWDYKTAIISTILHNLFSDSDHKAKVTDYMVTTQKQSTNERQSVEDQKKLIYMYTAGQII